MKKIGHIGIAVKKLSVSIPLFEKLLNSPCYKTEARKEGADNKLVCFLHPKSTNGVLIELCMEKKWRPGTE